ncbi:Exodeoxyribonuclease I [Buchnera aphidicola (Eriosoma lanigerum)]|uniref:exodeoxyribonuclease I n=1 Tax=Buchnera aphidicola TaxID=9 RepID=UPI003463986A
MNLTKNFLFYDYETFGICPALDKIAQFSCVRTDLDFNIIDVSSLIYCIPSIDYLPHPESVIITGITPQDIFKKNGLKECDFAKIVHDYFSISNTCILGYNNIQFDDEVTRNLFYRNFFDPYEWSWKNNNSRWDIINVLRACYVISPDGLFWYKDKFNYPIFKLSYFSKLNNIKHLDVHNALSDVYATIEVAKLLKEKKNKLFNCLFYLRKKQNILNFIQYPELKLIIYISSIFGAKRNNMSIIVPILWHPKNNNILIFFDLFYNVLNLLNILNSVIITDITFIQLYQSGLNFLYINKCPSLFSESIFNSKDYYRLSIDKNLIINNFHVIKKNIHFIKKKIFNYFSVKTFISKSDNVDLQLYNNFFSSHDKKNMRLIRNCIPNKLANIKLSFHDCRMKELLFRYRARNYFFSLSNVEQLVWKKYCKTVLNDHYLKDYKLLLKSLFKLYKYNPEKIFLLKKIYIYFLKIMNFIYK